MGSTSKTNAPRAASLKSERTSQNEMHKLTLTRITILAAMFTAMLAAQRPFGVLTSGSPPDTATMVQNQVSRLTSLLSLTTSQASQATTIFTNAANAITPLQTQMSADYTSLAGAVKSNTTATIDQLASQIGSLQGQIIDIQNKADAAFYAILTSSQQATLNQTNLPGRGGFGFGPGPGGPPR